MLAVCKFLAEAIFDSLTCGASHIVSDAWQIAYFDCIGIRLWLRDSAHGICFDYGIRKSLASFLKLLCR